MPNINEMQNSNYLKASDFDLKGTTLTIRTVQEETLGSGKDAKDKWVIYFEEQEKGLVLNVTNMNMIAELHGDETDDWEGKQVVLYRTKAEYQGKRVDAVRVKDEVPVVARKGKPTAAPASKAKAAPVKTRGGKTQNEDEDEADEDDVPY